MFQKLIDISVVCASANGKRKLPKLVKSISQGSVIPKELIIVGTNLSDKQLLEKYLNNKINFKFLISKKKIKYIKEILQKNSQNII